MERLPDLNSGSLYRARASYRQKDRVSRTNIFDSSLYAQANASSCYSSEHVNTRVTHIQCCPRPTAAPPSGIFQPENPQPRVRHTACQRHVEAAVSANRPMNKSSISIPHRLSALVTLLAFLFGLMQPALCTASMSRGSLIFHQEDNLRRTL